MNIEQLKGRDYVLVLDKSGSMSTKDCQGGKSRWDAAKESTLALAGKISEFDPDGITVIPFNGSFKAYEGVTEQKVASIFAENEPIGGTTLAPVLQHVFNDYIKRKAAGQAKPNGEMLLVVTDGEPNDPNEVAKAIVNFSNKLDNADAEYGISFIQVGKDSGAASYLKRLDDNLTREGAKHDIVDTKTMEELENIGLTEALVAALTD